MNFIKFIKSLFTKKARHQKPKMRNYEMVGGLLDGEYKSIPCNKLVLKHIEVTESGRIAHGYMKLKDGKFHYVGVVEEINL